MNEDHFNKIELDAIDRPVLLLDEQKCRANIDRMIHKASSNGVRFRPHFKTHQSLEIGRWFKERGVKSIAVSSIKMAQYFASEWEDITIAFPFNFHEIDALNDLSNTHRINVLLESEETLTFLKENIRSLLGFYIKIDTGYHRTGIAYNDFDRIRSILNLSEKDGLTEFRGFLTHAGNTYDCTSRDEIMKIHKESIARMVQLKEKYIKEFPDLKISVGDTPSCSIAEDFSGVDEIRPGNFVFYDLMQEQIGSCMESNIAVAVACPIVAMHQERNELIVYGGKIHFSAEYLEDGTYGKIYGRVVESNTSSWGKTVHGMLLNKLSQEHGTVKVPGDYFDKFSIGDVLYILPVHSCLTADLFESYFGLEGNWINKLWFL